MTLEILETYGSDDLAVVYVASAGVPERGNGDERLLEFVESLQPPHNRNEKWVLIVSSLFGCPVDCPMCDAGGDFRGRPTADDILAQLDAMVLSRYPDGCVPAEKFKVQFARMGDPAFNPAVLEVLRGLSGRYRAPGLMPCISTVAPAGKEGFFDELLEIKDEYYGGGRFQLQFSVHTTDPVARDRLIPVKKWGLDEIAAFGLRWHRPGDRLVTLNFAPIKGYPIDPDAMARTFDPGRFVIKLTPMNPTMNAAGHNLCSVIDGHHPESAAHLVEGFREKGFKVLLSIGNLGENAIGSNCGQYARAMRGAR